MRSIFAVILLVLMSVPALATEPAMDGRFGPGPHFLQPKMLADYSRKRAPRHVSRKPHAGKLAKPVEIPQTHERVGRYVAEVLGGRPADCTQHGKPIPWCGCFMAKHLGLPRNYQGLNLDRAIEWRSVGTAASGPGRDVIAVWRNHVGQIKQVTGPQRAVVLSGNDSHAIRIRERSLRGVIAYRHVGARYAALLQ